MTALLFPNLNIRGVAPYREVWGRLIRTLALPPVSFCYNRMSNSTTPAMGYFDDRPFGPDAKIFVAYETYQKLSATGDPVVALRWLPVPYEDMPPDDTRDGLFESFREEGALAARIEEGHVIDERLFTPDPDLPLRYIVTHPLLGCAECYEFCTLDDAKGVWPDSEFVGDKGGLLVIDRQTGPQFAGHIVRYYREMVADSLRDVPVIREGTDDKPPSDGSYVWVSSPGTRYRRSPVGRSPDLAETPATRIVSQSRDVIPYHKERCLWPSAISDWFVIAYGIEGAIAAAVEAIRIARSPRSYDPYHHFKEWGRSLPHGEILVIGNNDLTR